MIPKICLPADEQILKYNSLCCVNLAPEFKAIGQIKLPTASYWVEVGRFFRYLSVCHRTGPYTALEEKRNGENTRFPSELMG